VSTPPPLLELRGVSRVYASGEAEVRALDEFSLSVEQGEFVAIVGQSGSGKSTLMNILGCLDRPSQGSYRVGGRDVATLERDELAALRRDTFGFVFQRYNLLPTASAAENVEIPAIYAGRGRRERAERAHALLARLGIADRGTHRPNQLSGGQQQRVSIARALMNGAEVILADEPTGALDSRSGAEVLTLLEQLHAEGHTILLITHDAEVASHAERVIRLADGRLVEDTGGSGRSRASARPAWQRPARHPGLLPDLAEAIKMALRSLRANLFRSALTLLGVIIGVAAVVAMLAIGDGSKQAVMQRIESMGTNLLLIRPAGGMRGGDSSALSTGDAAAIAELSNIAAVSPERATRNTLRLGNLDYRSSVQGVWPGFATARDWDLAAGTFITEPDLGSFAPVMVIGRTVADNLFPDGSEPVGRYVLVGRVPFEVVGVLSAKGANAWGADMDDVALVPLSTGFMRLFGQQHVDSITVKVQSAAGIQHTEDAIRELLLARHGSEAFRIRNTAAILETAEATQNTLTVLLGSVAAISLLVGGIGVMNIMLVSVTERTREIGVRMATGARAGSILLQFNTEALVVCGIGGLIGVALGLAAAAIAGGFGMPVMFSAIPPLLAFSFAFATGLLFGYLPARKASRLDPVVALASE
jgi:macrolide transport system ATP-binding/permease protein